MVGEGTEEDTSALGGTKEDAAGKEAEDILACL